MTSGKKALDDLRKIIAEIPDERADYKSSLARVERALASMVHMEERGENSRDVGLSILDNTVYALRSSLLSSEEEKNNKCLAYLSLLTL